MITTFAWSTTLAWVVMAGLTALVMVIIECQYRRVLASRRIKGREILPPDILYAAFADGLPRDVEEGEFHRIIAALAKAVCVAPGMLRPDDIVLETFQIPVHTSRLRWLQPFDDRWRLYDFNIPQRIYEEIEWEFDVVVDDAVAWDRVVTIRDLINCLVELLTQELGSVSGLGLPSLHPTPCRDDGRSKGETD